MILLREILSSQMTRQMLIKEVEEENIGCHSPVGGHKSLQSCCQRDKSIHSLEELGKHIRDKERTSKDFLDAKANEFKA